MKQRLMCLVLACLFLGLGSSAWAAPEIGLSNDGVNFGPALAQPIFDPQLRWVPGDAHTGSFYVRNQGPSRALMTIVARSRNGDRLFTGNDITLRARVAGGAWFTLNDGVTSADLTEAGIPRGQVVRVDVNARFLFASPNATQLRPLRAVFEVSLRQDPTDRSHHGQGGLPSTGGPRLWVLFAGSAALGLGLALVRSRRTEEQEAADVAF